MVRIDISGLNELNRRLKEAPEKVKRQAGEAIEFAAKGYVTKAKQSASSQFGDKGNLAGGIQWVKNSPLQATVTSNAFYSAYFEWGTITHVSVPAELKEYAIQFKGKGIRKTGGIIPRPFFFQHQPVIEKQLIQDLTDIVDGI